MNELIKAGLDAMIATGDVALGQDEALTIIAIAYAQARVLWNDEGSQDQLAACISAARAAYMAGKERRTMFAGYG